MRHNYQARLTWDGKSSSRAKRGIAIVPKESIVILRRQPKDPHSPDRGHYREDPLEQIQHPEPRGSGWLPDMINLTIDRPGALAGLIEALGVADVSIEVGVNIEVLDRGHGLLTFG